jgi:hypothetical protein
MKYLGNKTTNDISGIEEIPKFIIQYDNPILLLYSRSIVLQLKSLYQNTLKDNILVS